MMLRLLILLLALLAVSGPALAHDARPLSITMIEQTPGAFRVVVLTPPTLEADNAPAIVWPGDCTMQTAAPVSIGAGQTGLMSCAADLSGGMLRIDYPAYNPSLTTLVRVETLDGPARTAVLPPDQLEWVVPERPTPLTVARDYLILGFQHIWEGPDHLMFVAGLMMLAQRPRRILLAVTGFTAAHSITLSLATLGLVRVPIPFVEAMIALSIVFLAAELARGKTDSFSRRYPVALSFVFGLLHGFGFASALGDIGLPAGALATGLIFFNLGVEAGQLAFIAAAGALILFLGLAGVTRLPALAPVRARAMTAGAYVLGLPAAVWFFERASGAFA